MLGSVKVFNEHKLEICGKAIMQVTILWNYYIINYNNIASQRLIQLRV